MSKITMVRRLGCLFFFFFFFFRFLTGTARVNFFSFYWWVPTKATGNGIVSRIFTYVLLKNEKTKNGNVSEQGPNVNVNGAETSSTLIYR